MAGASQQRTDSATPTVIWAPQPGPQTALLACPIFEVFYGGARGGGKTDGMLGEFPQHAQRYGEHAIGVFFRRELTQLDEAIARAHQLYRPIGAEWQEQKKQYTFPNGARLKFRYLSRDADAENYMGHSYTRVYFEELTNFPEKKPVMKLKATLRSAHGVPCRFRATGNPGGPGHQWVKARYISPAPQGYTPLTEHDKDTGLSETRVFIPAKVGHNRILMDADPSYIMRLKQSGSEELVRAWLDGDWDVIEGAFFDCWRPDKHVIRPVSLPEHWMRFRSIDWGSARPFSVGWWAVATEPFGHEQGTIPRGALIRYREWYGATEPNVGVKMTAEAVAAGILAKTPKDEEITYTVADPAIWIQDGGPSIMERMLKAGLHGIRRGDNKRVAARGQLGGWDQVRARLVGEDDRPMLYVFSTCADLIRTLPALQHDENRPEDVDTEMEDHAPDECRYACMSRPYTQPKPVAPKDIAAPATFDQHLKRHLKRRRAERAA